MLTLSYQWVLDLRCVPKYGGVLIDMKKMDKILEINEADLHVRVRPGVANVSKTDSVVPVGKNVGMILNLTAQGVK